MSVSFHNTSIPGLVSFVDDQHLQHLRLTTDHRVQCCLILMQRKAMGDEWSEIQEASAKNLHGVGPGGRGGPEDAQNGQVFEGKDIALYAEMGAGTGNALQHHPATPTRQPQRLFNPRRAVASFKYQVGSLPRRQRAYQRLRV